jgi:diacylglycerol kinase family enzyme
MLLRSIPFLPGPSLAARADLATLEPALAARHAARVPLPFPRALIVANPIAGSGRARGAAEELERRLTAAGTECSLFLTGGRGEGREAVRARHGSYDVVVSVGGDGTVREVLDGLVDPAIPVAIFALGTANVMSLDLGLPRDPEGVARAVLGGKTGALDVARVDGGVLSFLVTGVGLDAQIVQELEHLRRGPITKRTWARAGWRALVKAPMPRLQVVLDGRPIEGEYAQILFANIVHYGGFRVLARDMRIDDGAWELYLFPARSKLHVLGHGLRALASGFPSGTVRRERGRRLEVRSERPALVQVDGDAHGTTPATIEVEGIQRKLVLP